MHTKALIHAEPALEFDQFDCLPDSLVLLILNKLEDMRSLGRCSAVSKRFNGLVPLVHDVCVRIDRVVAVDGDSDDALNLSSPKPQNIFWHFLKLMLFTIAKPFHDLRNQNGTGQPLFPQLAQHSPVQVLRNFSHIRNLCVELPSGDVGTEEGVLLKWRAEYGSTLQNCVILGGTLVDRKPTGNEHEPLPEDNGSMPESFYTNGGLKLRVVWTISCLIAASTRHYLLPSIIKDHPTLRSLVLADADGQGTLCMGTEQLKEFRENELSASACSNRTQVPACNMKLKYAPYLELPGGSALQGATLLVIKPANNGSCSGHGSRKEAEAFVSESRVVSISPPMAATSCGEKSVPDADLPVPETDPVSIASPNCGLLPWHNVDLLSCWYFQHLLNFRKEELNSTKCADLRKVLVESLDDLMLKGVTTALNDPVGRTANLMENNKHRRSLLVLATNSSNLAAMESNTVIGEVTGLTCLFSDGQFVKMVYYMVRICEEQLKRSRMEEFTSSKSSELYIVTLLQWILPLLLQLLQCIHGLWDETIRCYLSEELEMAKYPDPFLPFNCTSKLAFTKKMEGSQEKETQALLETRALLEGIRQSGGGQGDSGVWRDLK
ncbi:F-box protein At4g18380-like isoform X2 [Phragmites australis]|uniref:F-box protein At4g18380-like isoform X2 n=1 Tax=Phragmites australis TaxID=29695 RepID=UPI002D769C6D|nr:F-box protein At4g18380-like isoform X2 [Phragmites australis]